MHPDNIYRLPLRTLLLLFCAILLVTVSACNQSDSPPIAATPIYVSVSSVTPAAGATNVALNRSISVTFSESMDPLTMIPANLSIDGLAAGVVTYNSSSKIATYTPIASLTVSTAYTFRISASVRSLVGHKLAAVYTWSFTTGATADVTPPTVTSVTPQANSIGVSINTSMTATFSEAMLPSSITSASFSLSAGAANLAANLSYSDAGRVATLVPLVALTASTVYTVTISNAVQDLAGNALAVGHVWSFTSGATADTTSPTVTTVNPSVGANGVATNAAINATFSEAIDPSSASTLTFKLTGPQSAIVSGVISHVDLSGIVTFTPLSALSASTLYTATLTTGLKDLAGNALASAFNWSFTTAASADTTPPTVLSSAPSALASDVATNALLTATFSESMNPATINATTFQLSVTAGAAVIGSVNYADAGHSARFTPESELLPTTNYTATVSVGVKDLKGNALVTPFEWTFTTAAAGDTTAPTVMSTNPVDVALNVAINQTVNATMSEAMDPASLTTATFMLRGPGTTLVSATVSYSSLTNIATLSPFADLVPDTLYTATVTTGARDLAAIALALDYEWTFTTANLVGAQSVALGAAAPFAVLAGTSVENINGTVVNGDLGISPGTSLTGFPIGVVNGTIHAGNPTSAAAMLALTAAYNDAKGRSLNAISLPGNLGGLTLTPGLYSNSSSSGISGTGANAILTLDAQGDSNAVFIFQMGSTLITDSGTSIVLAGGASAANIFWQVSSSATLGTNSIFYGTILADQSITLTTGVVMTGRALTRIGSVTLDSNTITLP